MMAMVVPRRSRADRRTVGMIVAAVLEKRNLVELAL
jgi:hypothetical protein